MNAANLHKILNILMWQRAKPQCLMEVFTKSQKREDKFRDLGSVLLFSWRSPCCEQI